uniref:FAD-binding domain-containing protein n=1 Tax=Zea mays TaxID=4577 RepID=B4FUT2_MAIZE|nr:unknown [Zea mays]
MEEDGVGGAKTLQLHLADGSTIKAKVVIGCDGVNSVVAQWLGLPKPILSGRSATRGLLRHLRLLELHLVPVPRGRRRRGERGQDAEPRGRQAAGRQGPGRGAGGGGAERDERRGVVAAAVPVPAGAGPRQHQPRRRVRGGRRAAPHDAGARAGRVRGARGRRRPGPVPGQGLRPARPGAG